jgi:hypothetical protein
MKKHHLSIFALLAFLLFANSCKQDSTNQDTSVAKDQSDSTKNELIGKIVEKSAVLPKYIVHAAAKSKSNNLDVLVTATDNCADLENTLKKLTIGDLNSGSGYEYYKFTKDNSAGASFMGFGATLDNKHLLIIKDYVRYTFISCNGVKKRYGIGLRSYILINTTNTKITGSLANVAANVQLGKAQASYNMESLGFAVNGDQFAEDTGAGDFNVDNFSKVFVSYSNALKTLSDKNKDMKISAVELPDKSLSQPGIN